MTYYVRGYWIDVERKRDGVWHIANVGEQYDKRVFAPPEVGSYACASLRCGFGGYRVEEMVTEQPEGVLCNRCSPPIPAAEEEVA